MSRRNAALRHRFRARHPTSHSIVEARAIGVVRAVEDVYGQETGYVFSETRDRSRAYHAKAEEQLRARHEHWPRFPEARHR